jgi:hypothetical protein
MLVETLEQELKEPRWRVVLASAWWSATATPKPPINAAIATDWH